MFSAEPFCTGMASLQRVKWSDNTNMFVFPLGVAGNGPTRSRDTICHGRPACNRCLLELATGLLCFEAWHTSQELINLLVSAVSPGQHHSFWILFIVLSIPIWPWRWISQIIGNGLVLEAEQSIAQSHPVMHSTTDNPFTQTACLCKGE